MTKRHPTPLDASLRDDAKAWLRHHPIEAASAVTLAAYRRDCRRLWSEARSTGESIELLIARTGTIDDWCRFQAAIYWRSARLLSRLMVRYELQLAQGQGASRVLLSAMSEAVRMLRRIEEMPELIVRGRRRRASRLDLLPPDWQEQLVRCASASEQVALLMFSLTGARPIELAAGVGFRIVSGDDAERLELTLRGAKRSAGSGQATRVLSFASNGTDTVKVRQLIDLLARDTGSVRSSALEIAGTAAVKPHANDWMQRLGRAIWPELDEQPTPYSFRYAFRRRALAQGLDATDQALAFGHQSTTSAWAYGAQLPGHKQQGGGVKVRGACRPRQQVQMHRALSEASQDQSMQRERDRRELTLQREIAMTR